MAYIIHLKNVQICFFLSYRLLFPLNFSHFDTKERDGEREREKEEGRERCLLKIWEGITSFKNLRRNISANLLLDDSFFFHIFIR